MAKNDSIGALWKKSVNGKELLSGLIELDGKKYKLAIWQNDYKKEDKHPDYKVYIDTYEPNNRQQTPPAANNTDNTIVPGDSLPF